MAGLPPLDPMMAGAAPAEAPPMSGGMDPAMMGAPASPIDAVLAALMGLQAQRQSEDDVVLAAVMKATGGMPSGMEGVSEGAAFGAPMAPEMGAY